MIDTTPYSSSNWFKSNKINDDDDDNSHTHAHSLTHSPYWSNNNKISDGDVTTIEILTKLTMLQLIQDWISLKITINTRSNLFDNNNLFFQVFISKARGARASPFNAMFFLRKNRPVRWISDLTTTTDYPISICRKSFVDSWIMSSLHVTQI